MLYIDLYKEAADRYEVVKLTNSKGQPVQIKAAAPIYSGCTDWTKKAAGLRVWQTYQNKTAAADRAAAALESDDFAALQSTVEAGKAADATAEVKAAAAVAAEEIADAAQKAQDARAWADAWGTAAAKIDAEKWAEKARKDSVLLAFLTAYDFRAEKGVKTFGPIWTDDTPDAKPFIWKAAKDPETMEAVATIRDYATRFPAHVEKWDDIRRAAYKQAARPAVDKIAAKYCHGKPGFRANLSAKQYDEAISQCGPVTVTLKSGEQTQRARTDEECFIRVLKSLMDCLTEKLSKIPAPDAHSTTAGNAAKDAQKTGKTGKTEKKTGKQKPKQEAPKTEAEEGGIRPKTEAPKAEKQ